MMETGGIVGNVRRLISNNLHFLGAAIFGLTLTTIVVSPERPIFPGWSIPLANSSLPTSDIYSAKAALLAILGACSLTLTLKYAPSNERTHTPMQGTTALAALGAGWFWLKSATGDHLDAFLIAIAPSAIWVVLLVLTANLLIETRKAQERQQGRIGKRLWVFTFGIYAIAIAVTALAIWLPSRWS